MSLSYADVKSFIQTGLTAKGYVSGTPAGPVVSTMPLIDPGPFSIASLQSLSPGPMVFATVGNGAGLVLEQTYDLVFVTIRSIGPQNDYSAAERLASDLDGLFLAINSNGLVGATRVLWVNRSGGAPQLIDYDAANRYHFQTTYITPASTGY